MKFGGCVIGRGGRRSAVHLGLTAVWATLMLVVSVLSLCASDAGAFTAVSQGDHRNVTVMEVSGNYDARNPDGTVNFLSRAEIAKEFYKTHGDDFDFLVIFTNFDFMMPAPTVKAFYQPVKNDIQGIGQSVTNNTGHYGSHGKLQGTVDMENLFGHVSDPLDPSFESTLNVMTHELMHRWGAMVKFIDSSGNPSSALLGQDGAHWSYLLDSGGSTLYGNHWRDNGDGTFTSIAPDHAQKGSAHGRIFSPLELYLMGLYGKAQVPPMLLIDSPTIDATQFPKLDVTIPGTATYVTIDQIIAAEGERIPAVADAQKTFKVGFIYATTPGTWNMREVIAIDTIRTEWEKRFSILTGGVGLVKTILQPDENVPTNPGVTPSNPTLTNNPDANIGVSWLTGRQQADGSWQDQAGTASRDTAAAVAALKPFSATSLNYQQGRTWLGTAQPGNTDYLARKVASLGSAGTALTELLGRQNADGGWGSAAGYLSNPLDTALALKALAAAGQSGGSAVGNAINYLTSSQKADGGWSAGSGSSMVQPTAMTLSVFHGYRANYPLDGKIAAASAWLAARQNADGGFGNSPSTVYDTAAAVTALRQVGATQAAIDAGFNYLLTTQSQDGSWNNSTFQTALAVEAIWGGRFAPDLAVTAADIAFNPVAFSAFPANVTVTATIRNLGVESASQVGVAVFRGDPAQGNPLQEKLVDVPGKGSVAATFVVPVPEFGQHPFTIVVDRGGLVAESNEWNNTAAKTLTTTQPPPTVVINSPKGVVTTSTPLLDYVAQGAEGVVVRVDGVVTYRVSGDHLAPLADGEHTLTVVATNQFGSSSTLTENFTVNAQPTSVKIRYPYENGIIAETTPPLVYDQSKPGTVTVMVDGVVVPKVSGDTLGTFASGSHTVRVTIVDNFGVSASDEVRFVVSAGSEPPYVLQWSKPLEVGYGNSVATDINGNIVVVDKDSSSRFRISKYDSVGNSLWTDVPWPNVASNNVDVPSDLNRMFVKIDSEGNIYSAFYSSSSRDEFVAKGSLDVYVVKYNSEGQRNWVRQVASTQAEVVHDIVVDHNDNIYLFGVTAGDIFLGDGYLWNPFVTKYDNTGKQVWGRQLSISTLLGGYTTVLPDGWFGAVDLAGNVYIGGDTGGSFGFKQAINGGPDYFLVKYNSSGVMVWDLQHGNSGSELIHGLEADAFGNLYLLGSTSGSFDGQVNAGLTDMFLAKYDSNKQLQWLHQWGTAGADVPSGFGLEKDGDAYVIAGKTITKFDRNKNLLWEQTYALNSSFDKRETTFDRRGSVFAFSGSILNKFSDPRLPAVVVNPVSPTNQATVTVTGSAPAGCTLEVRTDKGGSCVPQFTGSTTWTCALSGLSEGSNNVTVQATNGGGFKGYGYGVVVYDVTPPTIDIFSPTENATYTEKPVAEFGFSDGTAKVYVNGTLYVNWGGPLGGLLPGANTFRAEAVDEAGNQSVAEVHFFAAGGAVGERAYEPTLSVQQGTAGSDTVDDLVRDANNNVYMVGTTYGNLGGQTSLGKADAFVSKYDSAGNRLWTKLYGSANDDFGKGLAVDAAGNFYLLREVRYASVSAGSNNWSDVVLSKYSPTGSQLWTKTVGSTVRDYASSLVLDSADNVYIAGTTEGSIDSKAFGGGSDFFLAKYDKSGVKKWTVLSGLAGNESIEDIAWHKDGYIYVTGQAGSNLPFFYVYTTNGTKVFPLLSDGYIYNAPDSGRANAIHVANDGWVYVVGSVNHNDGQNNEIFVAEIFDAGLDWITEFGSNGDDVPLGISGDSSGMYYVVGSTNGALPGGANVGGKDNFVTKFDGNYSGDLKWLTQFGTSSDDEGIGVTVGSDGSVFVGGNTYGSLGGNPAGNSDVFLVKMAPPQGPSLTVNPVVSPSRLTTQTISGTVGGGATLSVRVDSPAGSLATVSGLTKNPNGSWTFQINGLMPNASNALVVTATDPTGSRSKTVTLDVDTMPPALTVTPVVSPTTISSQTVNGTVESGALLTVEVNPPSSPQAVSVNSGSWSYPIASLLESENIVRFRAVDPVGNETVKTVSIVFAPPLPLSARFVPASISSLDQVPVALTVSNIKPNGAQVLVEQVLDLNHNQRVDVGEPLVRTFRITDGMPLSNPNIQSDEDGFVDGKIVTTLNYHFPHDLLHAPGGYVFRLSTVTETVEVPFQVTAASQSQTIQGSVQGPAGVYIPGALVEVTDKWGRSLGFGRTDASGNFILNIKNPGEYFLIPSSAGYVADKSTLTAIVLGPSQTISGVNLVLKTGTFTVTGAVKDKVSVAGLEGVWVTAENSQYVGRILTGSNGSYSLKLPAGNYELMAGSVSSASASEKGYLGFERSGLTLAISASSAGNDLLLPGSQQLVCGQVTDASAMKVTGTPVQAVLIGQTSAPLASAISDGSGQYCLGLISGTSWRISLNDGLAQGLGLVANRLDGVSTTSGPFTGKNLSTQTVNAWVGGTVRDSNGAVVGNVPIEMTTTAGIHRVTGQTASNGTYRLGIFSGNWQVSVLAEGLGYNPVVPVAVTATVGQVLSRDFVLTRPQASVTIAPVTTPTTQDNQTLSGTRSKDASIGVVVNTAALVGPVSYPTTTTWNCTLTKFATGLNNITVTAQAAGGSTATAQTGITYNAPVVNSIVITKALYTKKTKILTVQATSALRQNAALQLQGYGPMVWSSSTSRWTLDVRPATTPANVTVSGPEGSKTLTVTVK